MTQESALTAPEKMEAARLRASLADVFFAKFNSAGEMKRFFRWFFYGRASSARGVTGD
jgi:hypothetical protein